jgi:hypothetical protein
VKAEIKMVIWLYVAIILGFVVIGFATKSDNLLRVLGMDGTGPAREPLHAAQSPTAAETPAPSSSTRPGGRPTSPEVAAPPRNSHRSLLWRTPRPAVSVRSVE